jgi:hypothetical protein
MGRFAMALLLFAMAAALALAQPPAVDGRVPSPGPEKI